MVAWIKFPAHMLQALWALVELARAVVDRISAHTDLERRVAELERQRALWEANMEAALGRVEEQFKAARRTEERTRNMLRREAEDDEAEASPEIPTNWRAAIDAHAATGPSAGVPPVPPRVAEREAARARKWGRS